MFCGFRSLLTSDSASSQNSLQEAIFPTSRDASAASSWAEGKCCAIYPIDRSSDWSLVAGLPDLASCACITGLGKVTAEGRNNCEPNFRRKVHQEIAETNDVWRILGFLEVVLGDF